MSVILFGKRVFANVINLEALRLEHPGLSGYTLNLMTHVMKERHRHREGGHVMTEAETGVMGLQVEECHGLLAATGRD